MQIMSSDLDDDYLDDDAERPQYSPGEPARKYETTEARKALSDRDAQRSVSRRDLKLV